VWLIRDDVTVAANLLAQAVSDSVASHVFGVVPLFVLTGFLVAHAGRGQGTPSRWRTRPFRRIRGGARSDHYRGAP
jgi:C4-dicarboxylate transporter DctM subunit